MLLFGQGSEMVSQAIIWILGFATMVQVGNVIYSDPQLSLNIAANAHRHPLTAFEYFLTPFSSFRQEDITTVEVPRPNARQETHTVTATEYTSPSPLEVEELSKKMLAEPEQSTESAYKVCCSSYPSDPGCPSTSSVNDVQQDFTDVAGSPTPDQISMEVHNADHASDNINHEAPLQKPPIDQGNPKTSMFSEQTTTRSYVRDQSSGELMLVDKVVSPTRQTPTTIHTQWLAGHFQNFLNIMADNETRNTFIILTSLVAFVTRLIADSTWKERQRRFEKAAEKKAAASVEFRMSDLRDQLASSEGYISILKKSKVDLMDAQNIFLDKVYAELAVERAKIVDLEVDVYGKDARIAELQKQIEALKGAEKEIMLPKPSKLAILLKEKNHLDVPAGVVQTWLNEKRCGICGAAEHISTNCPKKVV